MPLRSLLPPLAMFGLAACAVAETNPPSLAHRDVEGILDQPMRAIAPAASANDPALASRIGELVAQAEVGQRDFAAALPSAQSAVQRARGAARESEAWIAAQLAISALDGTRSETTTALGELDAILGAQTAGGALAETDRLTEAREQVLALYDAQNASYQTLLAGLRS